MLNNYTRHESLTQTIEKNEIEKKTSLRLGSLKNDWC
jgi:hypothetical protein